MKSESDICIHIKQHIYLLILKYMLSKSDIFIHIRTRQEIQYLFIYFEVHVFYYVTFVLLHG